MAPRPTGSRARRHALPSAPTVGRQRSASTTRSRATAPALSSGSLPVAALRRLHARRAARGRTGSARPPPRAWPRGAGGRRRSRARRCRRRPGSRRRSRSSAGRCRPGSAVDTPPTSHRSQMVNSGRIPMPACSTACSVPGHLRRVEPAPLEHGVVDRVPEAPGSPSRRRRQVEVLGAEHLAGCRCRAARSPTTCSRPRPRRGAAPTRPTVGALVVAEDAHATGRCGPACTRRPSAGSHARDPVVEVELHRPGTLARGAGRRRRGAPTSKARPASTVPTRRPSALGDAVLVRRARCAGRRPAPASPGPLQNGPAAAHPQPVVRARAGARRRRGRRPTSASSSGVSGSS